MPANAPTHLLKFTLLTWFYAGNQPVVNNHILNNPDYTGNMDTGSFIYPDQGGKLTLFGFSPTILYRSTQKKRRETFASRRYFVLV